MNHTPFCLAIVSILICCSCRKTSQENLIENIDFEFNESKDNLNFKDLTDTIYEPITLETTDECIIGEFSKIAYRHDTIFVVDKQTKSVFLFNDTGKYLSKLCRIGRGPQEYFELTDVFVGNGHILILDNYQYKVCCYDYNGEFMFGFNSKEGVRLFEHEGKILVCTTWGGGSFWNDCLIAEFEENGKMTNTYFKKNKKDNNRNNHHHDFFVETTYGVDFIPLSKNTVYTFSNDKFIPSYKVDLGKFEMPENVAKLSVPELIENGYVKEYSLGVEKIQETERFRFITATFENSYTLVYDIKRKENVHTYLYSISIDDFKFPIERCHLHDNYLFMSINGSLLCNFRDGIWSKNPPEGFSDILYQASKNLTDTDNGVIIRMKLKGNDED